MLTDHYEIRSFSSYQSLHCYNVSFIIPSCCVYDNNKLYKKNVVAVEALAVPDPAGGDYYIPRTHDLLYERDGRGNRKKEI